MATESGNAEGIPAAPRRAGNGRRRRVLLTLLASVALAALGYGVYWMLVGRWYESTDDAYVQADLVSLTPQVAGTVVAVNTANTQYVRRGETVVRLDDTDAKVALAQAEADLAQTVRQVAQAFQQAQVDRAAVQLASAQLRKTRQDFQRARTLAPAHGVSREQLQHAQAAFVAAQAELAQAEHRLAAARALIAGTTPADHPQVKQAEARVRKAWVALARTRILAPVSGYVAQKSVEVGEQVAPGTPLLAIVPLASVYVDANFKETQLTELRLGQPVSLTADLYGSGVTFHGKVLGFSAGTGSAFAVLPPQNASGNWIKIVQRLPVRIGLDPAELAAHPLSVGLSMNVEVDTHDRRGQRLSRQPTWNARQATAVYAAQTAGADAAIARIVRDNLPATAVRGAGAR